MNECIRDFYMYKASKENPLALALSLERITGEDYMNILEKIKKNIAIIESEV